MKKLNTFQFQYTQGKKLLLLFFFAGVITMLSSCGRSTLFDNSTSLHNSWYMNDPVVYDVDVKDTVHGFDFYVNLRHNDNYRFSNLYVFLQTEFPNHHVTRDTLQFILADPSGKWLGKGWGKIKSDHILLKQNLRFPLKGQYRFSIWQGMRADTLKGIENIGLQIERAQ